MSRGVEQISVEFYPPTAVGYPPTAIGDPPTAVGYPQPLSVTLRPPSVASSGAVQLCALRMHLPLDGPVFHIPINQRPKIFRNSAGTTQLSARNCTHETAPPVAERRWRGVSPTTAPAQAHGADSWDWAATGGGDPHSCIALPGAQAVLCSARRHGRLGPLPGHGVQNLPFY